MYPAMIAPSNRNSSLPTLPGSPAAGPRAERLRSGGRAGRFLALGSIASRRRLSFPGKPAETGACALVAGLCFAQSVQAAGPVPGAYSSRPGAAYTLYLDFGGFDYRGDWAGGSTPGFTSAYSVDGDLSSFSAHELSNIQRIWSQVATLYAPFNINVTTVDPAVAAGQASSDDARQAYYDSQLGMIHTIIGGVGFTGLLGSSPVGTAALAAPGFYGWHANFVRSTNNADNLPLLAQVVVHEMGHALGLEHQSDCLSGPLGPYSVMVNEYSAGTGTGPGSVSPIMGATTNAERQLWSIGTSGCGDFFIPGIIQNDAQIIANNAGLGGFIDDGIGHTRASATPLPQRGNAVDFTLARGVIVPASSSNPAPLGSANYRPDYWSFTTSGGPFTLTANSGDDYLTPGIADPGATLRTLLTLYDSNGTVVATSPTTSLSGTITTTLGAGSYSVSVTAVGNAIDPAFSGRQFFDMGPFFLTGTVPAAVGQTPLEQWRQSYFGISTNTGNAADAFDFDQDGVPNLIEFAFGLDPKNAASLQLPQAQITGGSLVITFIQPSGVSGIIYGAESSTNLLTWQPVGDTGAGTAHRFSVPTGSNKQMFMRLAVPRP